MITRDITTFEIQAVRSFATRNANGELVTDFEVLTPAIHVFDTSMTKTDGRKALISAGYDVPKGCQVLITPVAKVKYRCSVADFLSISSPVEEVAI